MANVPSVPRMVAGADQSQGLTLHTGVLCEERPAAALMRIPIAPSKFELICRWFCPIWGYLQIIPIRYSTSFFLPTTCQCTGEMERPRGSAQATVCAVALEYIAEQLGLALKWKCSLQALVGHRLEMGVLHCIPLLWVFPGSGNMFIYAM